jgi:F0F1-type ATP synthase membrane subunit c/vacuolar-type H+-ATPase subunit K
MFSRAAPVAKVTPSTPLSAVREEKKTPPEELVLVPSASSPVELCPDLSVGPPKLVRDDAYSPILSSMKSSLAKELKVRLGTAISLTASGAGFVNAVISVSTVSSVSEFANWATLFGEFFVQSMEVSYQPQSIYGTWPALAQGATGQPLAVLSLHHGIAAPSTITAAAENPSLKYAHTGVPWKYKWRNIEKRTSTVVPHPVATSATAVQAWCLSDSTSSSGYTGQMQFISPLVLGCGAAQPLGTFIVTYEVYFRNRQ